ncbi:hypothetical protein GUI12_04135 [Anaplasmataceae bacterium AB001_6]|nr:hypothetical protein GUI12_04135 [Anaplasmataceae bacterium AB001_6]
MLTVAINNYNNDLSLGIKDKNGKLFTHNVNTQNTAEMLHFCLKNLMNNNNYSFHDVDKIMVTVGPGSFTGIRACIAAVQGFRIVMPHIIILPVDLMKMVGFFAIKETDKRSYNVCIADRERFVYNQQIDKNLVAINKIQRIEKKNLILEDPSQVNCGNIEEVSIKIPINITNLLEFGEHCIQHNLKLQKLEPIYAY